MMNVIQDFAVINTLPMILKISLNLNFRFIHLTNNSIQQDNGNTWDCQTFSEYLKRQNAGQDIFRDKIKPAMENIAMMCLKSCNDQHEERNNSIELFGYDFMVDQDFETWIIEINKSPSMDRTNPITSRLVTQLQDDIIKVVIDYQQNKTQNQINTGKFRQIFIK